MSESGEGHQQPNITPEYRRLLTVSGWFAAPGSPLRKADSILDDGLPDIDEDHIVGHTNELMRVDANRKYMLAVDAHDEIAGMDDGFTRKENGAVRLAFIRFNSKDRAREDGAEKASGWISVWSDGTAHGYADFTTDCEEIDADFIRTLGMGDHVLPDPTDVHAFVERQFDKNDMNQLADTLQTYYFDQ